MRCAIPALGSHERNFALGADAIFDKFEVRELATSDEPPTSGYVAPRPTRGVRPEGLGALPGALKPPDASGAARPKVRRHNPRVALAGLGLRPRSSAFAQPSARQAGRLLLARAGAGDAALPTAASMRARPQRCAGCRPAPPPRTLGPTTFFLFTVLDRQGGRARVFRRAPPTLCRLLHAQPPYSWY